MAELNGVGDKGGFSCGVDYLEAALVLQGGTDVEAVAGARVEGLLWMSTRHTMGPKGVASKLKWPLKSSQAEARGRRWNGGEGLVIARFSVGACPVNSLGMRERCRQGS